MYALESALCRWSAKTLNNNDWIFDWEKGANGRINTWMFAGLVVLARDTEYSFRFLFT